MQAINQDNSSLRNKIKNSFETGNLKFNKGETLEQKKEGITYLLQGARDLKIWIERENDQGLKKQLTEIYTQRFKEIEEKMNYLEKYEQKVPMQEVNGDQKQQSGGGKDENENDKFKTALQSAIVTEKPNIKWTDIAGLEQAKKSLQEAVILPIRFPDLFKGARTPWKGILLYGPPGTGKTFLAKACATETEGTFLSISASDLISKYVGESEKLIKSMFQLAREKKPTIIFIDEIDSMLGNRSEGENEASRRVKTEFLVQMQGVGHDDTGILVLGATNLPWGLDPAVRRRFERRIYIPLPDETGRAFLLKHNLKNIEHTLNENDFQNIMQRTDGFSGSDMSILVRDAIFEPVRKFQKATKFKKVMVNNKEMYSPADDKETGNDIVEMNFYQVKQEQLLLERVSMNDFNAALIKCKSSVAKESLLEYENFTKNFGQDG